MKLAYCLVLCCAFFWALLVCSFDRFLRVVVYFCAHIILKSCFLLHCVVFLHRLRSAILSQSLSRQTSASLSF